MCSVGTKIRGRTAEKPLSQIILVCQVAFLKKHYDEMASALYRPFRTGTENENTPQSRRGNVWFMKETSHVGVEMLNDTALKALLWSFLWCQRTGHEGQWMREKARGRWISEQSVVQFCDWLNRSPHLPIVNRCLVYTWTLQCGTDRGSRYQHCCQQRCPHLTLSCSATAPAASEPHLSAGLRIGKSPGSSTAVTKAKMCKDHEWKWNYPN